MDDNRTVTGQIPHLIRKVVSLDEWLENVRLASDVFDANIPMSIQKIFMDQFEVLNDNQHSDRSCHLSANSI